MATQTSWKVYITNARQESYRKATPEYLKVLLETVEKEPSELGYEFGRWTGERLATYLAEQTGIQLSGSQVRRILKRKKYSYIWAKYSLEDKQNLQKRVEFKLKIARYLAISKENPEQLQVWFWDETGFSLRVIRRKNWGKKGKRKKITGQRRRGYNWRLKMRAAFNTDHSSYQQITRNKAALIFKASPRDELTSWEVFVKMTVSACASLLKKVMRTLFMNNYSS